MLRIFTKLDHVALITNTIGVLHGKIISAIPRSFDGMCFSMIFSVAARCGTSPVMLPANCMVVSRSEFPLYYGALSRFAACFAKMNINHANPSAIADVLNCSMKHAKKIKMRAQEKHFVCMSDLIECYVEITKKPFPDDARDYLLLIDK
jgi:hypothetical protein